MRFTISKAKLIKALLLASHGVGAKSANPQLSCFKIVVTEDCLEITASNEDQAVKTVIKASENGVDNIRSVVPGSSLVNAHILTEIVRKLAGEELSFEVVDQRVAKINDGIGVYKLVCMPTNDYPEVDFTASGAPLEIPGTDLTSLVEKTAFAASDKATHPILTTINLKAEGGRLVATATDSARMSKKQIAADSGSSFSVNIPAKTLLDVIKMFENSYAVTVSADKKRVVFRFGDTTVSCRVVDEDYPISDRIIPQRFSSSLQIDSAAFLAAIDRVSTLSVDRAAVVKLSLTNDEIELSSSSDQNGSGTERLVNASYEGDRLDIAFNSIFVTQAIRALGSEDVTIKFTGEMKPFVIVDPKDDSVIQLITPMRTR